MNARRTSLAWLVAFGIASLVALAVGFSALPRPAPHPVPRTASVEMAQCVARQQPGDIPAALVADPARFDCHTPPTRWGPGDYWVRLVPGADAGTGGADPVLRFLPQWQHTLTIYLAGSHGRLEARRLADDDISAAIGIGGAVGIPVEAEKVRAPILVRVDGALNASGLVVSPQLLDGTAFNRAERLATAVFAGFAGLGIGLLCYNLVLWFTIRERFQLTYCLSLMAMLAYVWGSSGAMAVQFPMVPQTARMAVCYVMLAFVAALALQFITDFIEPGKLPRRLRGFARHIGLGCVGAALAVALAPPEWRYLADRIYVATFVPVPLTVAVLASYAWRRRSAAIRVLAIAWATPLAVSLVRIAHALHLIENGPLVQYALVAAMSIEALLSSLAMSFRIKRLTDERDRARADEQAARHLASVDALTGLLNRRALLEQVIDWSSPEPLRLLIVDIDHFKQINDRYGHLVGDEVLREVAEALAIRADLRASVARIGGEEFALIGTAFELSEGIALGIIGDMRTRLLAGHVGVTVSIGMAEGMVHCEDEWRDLYRRADAALYTAKAEGRNRAVHAAPQSSAKAMAAA